MPRPEPCKALLVFPRFAGTSFWNYRATCDLMGARYPAAPLGLITVAALLPSTWELRLVDVNTRDLRDEDLAWADVVLTGGMLPQRRDTLHLIERAHAHGKPVVVGGPDATCAPEAYRAAEFLVLGEAEEIIAEFLAAWRAGAAGGTFVAASFPDLTRSPVPRFDLLRLDDYLHVGVQYSRGCPFSCEFCNVIELNGRVPRTKTPAQVLRELDVLRDLGYRGHVDFVDDNLIGNRKAARPFLEALAAWVRERRWPFEFSTEASLDLADDAELLSLLRAANFFAVFVGIETPDPEALRAAGKRQNLGRDIAQSVQAIHRAGLFVNAGFIVGFDSERGSVARAMGDCIEAAAIPVCMVGLLFALPGTRLARRLSAESRLPARAQEYGEDEADQCTSGINFHPLRPRVDVLRDYREVLDRIYAPAAYFDRALRAALSLDRSAHRLRPSLRHVLRGLRGFARMAWRQGVRDPRLRAFWWPQVLRCAWHNPGAVPILLSFSALYLHLGPYARQAVERLDREIAAADTAAADRAAG
jgi:radical SAM superfamily enzyme YgiQ (UPF0313 family)